MTYCIYTWKLIRENNAMKNIKSNLNSFREMNECFKSILVYNASSRETNLVVNEGGCF